jgi:hypothetical protein
MSFLNALIAHGQPLLILGLFVLLAVTSWYGGADSLSSSLTDSSGRPIRWTL